MSGGGGGGDTTTVQKADPWGGQQPYLTYGFQQAKNLYNTGGPQYFPNSTVTPFSPQSELALQLTQNRALAGSPVTTAAQGEATKTLNGGYLNNNPYLDSMYNQAAGDITSRVNGAFGQAGRTGSGINQQVLADSLGSTYNNIYGSNYNNERNRMEQTLALAPQTSGMDYADLDRLGGVGSAIDQQSQANLTDQMNRYNYQQNLPEQNLQRYIAAIQGNYGAATTTNASQDVSGNPIAGAIGGGLLGYTAGGALGGAMAGSAYGPYGALIGAGLGYLSSR